MTTIQMPHASSNNSTADGRRLIDAVLAKLKEFRKRYSLPELRDLLSDPDRAGEVLGDLRSMVNIVPGKWPGVCAPLVIGIACGQGEHREMMKALRASLIQCSGITIAAIALTDTWASWPSQHLDDWRAFTTKGVAMSAVIDGYGMRGPTELALDL